MWPLDDVSQDNKIRPPFKC